MDPLTFSSRHDPEEMALHSCFYLPAKNRVAGRKVLDLGCGEGIGAGFLLEWGAASVVGVDPAGPMIERATETFADRPGLRFVQSDLAAFCEAHGQDFDVILGIGMIGSLAEPEALLQVLARQKRADATVILSCPNDYFLYGRGVSLSPHHAEPFSFYEMRTITETHLGAASWYLGAPNNGFSAVPVDHAARPHGEGPGKGIDALKEPIPVTALAIPGCPTGQEHLKPSTALFYLGIWSSDVQGALYQTSFTATSHYRLPSVTRISKDVAAGHTRSIAFVIDQHDWAFDNIINNMKPYLEGRYSISVYYIADYEKKADLLHTLFVAGNFQNVHVMWREFLFAALTHRRTMMELLESSGMTSRELADSIAAPVLTTSVYDHLFLREEDIAERQEQFMLIDAYATSSAHLQAAYGAAYDKKPAVEISDGVDIGFFAPARAAQAQRSWKEEKVFKIGWVGNSSWGQNNESIIDDPKGLHSILKPAVEQLALEGYPVAFELADRSIRRRDRAEMIAYYGKIDVLVCSSAAEGTPNPVLEAMASGVPFVSTDVGIVREAAGPLQADFILQDRTVGGMYELLKRLLDEPHKLKDLAEENSLQIQNWQWRAKTTKWLHLFAEAEANHETFGRALRRTAVVTRLSMWEKAGR